MYKFFVIVLLYCIYTVYSGVIKNFRDVTPSVVNTKEEFEKNNLIYDKAIRIPISDLYIYDPGLRKIIDFKMYLRRCLYYQHKRIIYCEFDDMKYRDKYVMMNVYDNTISKGYDCDASYFYINDVIDKESFSLRFAENDIILSTNKLTTTDVFEIIEAGDTYYDLDKCFHIDLLQNDPKGCHYNWRRLCYNKVYVKKQPFSI